ncbi:MAG: GMC family oxidoreductase N-terminal domain-containing protein [Actinomycetia bacterium]|nr:GMC family oxidoreductase N-terminal domain-containing protein [Actinomycetes bacterium]
MAYDYVVVGAGSGGSAVVWRLAETGAQVLVLEAGGTDEREEIHIPAAFSALLRSPLDWEYETEPQKYLDDRTDYWPRGKVLGGSSSINAMIYQRGAQSDYDHWSELGNAGWSWDDMFPLFKRSENQERGASEYHGVGGPMNVADLRDPNPLSTTFVNACGEQGLPLTNDFNGASQEGFGLYQVNQKGGMRWSAADGYLHPALARGNVTAITRAHVTRLIVENGRCTGVAYDKGGEQLVANASLEVILCGGAINSPQVLMLSGIGPRQHLESLGIDVVHDVPGVGQNLQDHMMSPVAFNTDHEITLRSATTEEQVAKFESDRMGMLTSNIAEAGGFVTLFNGSPAPELQFHFVPAFSILHGVGSPEGHGFTLFPTLVGTRSVGRMWLRSADPYDKPHLDPAYLEDERDMDVLLEGTKMARDILRSAAFDEFRTTEHLPGDHIVSDEDLREHVRTYATGVYHPVGTVKMGSDDDAVVDDRLRVRGIKGLRVADASIMPVIVNANTNNPSIVIGEKCAQMVIDER